MHTNNDCIDHRVILKVFQGMNDDRLVVHFQKLLGSLLAVHPAADTTGKITAIFIIRSSYLFIYFAKNFISF